MKSLIIAIVATVSHRYAAYASALGMVCQGIYLCTAGDPTGGIQTMLLGWGSLAGLHHLINTAEAVAAPIDDQPTAPPPTIFTLAPPK